MKPITNAELEQLTDIPDVQEASAYLRALSRCLFENVRGEHSRRLDEALTGAWERRTKLKTYLSPDAGHVVGIDVHERRLRCAISNPDKNPVVYEFARVEGPQAKRLVEAADKLIEVTLTLIADMSTENRQHFANLEAAGGRRLVLCDLSNPRLSAFIVTHGGTLHQLAGFSSPTRGLMTTRTGEFIH